MTHANAAVKAVMQLEVAIARKRRGRFDLRDDLAIGSVENALFGLGEAEAVSRELLRYIDLIEVAESAAATARGIAHERVVCALSHLDWMRRHRPHDADVINHGRDDLTAAQAALDEAQGLAQTVAGICRAEREELTRLISDLVRAGRYQAGLARQLGIADYIDADLLAAVDAPLQASVSR